MDGEFLPEHPLELLASPDFHPVPSIIGVNKDEYGWLIPMVRPSSIPLGTRALIGWVAGAQTVIAQVPPTPH